MILTLTAALAQLHSDLAAVLVPTTLVELCRQHLAGWPERLLDPVTTIHMFLLQVLHRNTAITHLPLLIVRTFTPSAYCQA